MWSATFEAIPNLTIVESLRQRQIGKLILSTGTDDTLHEKAEELVELAGQNQISVDLLIGDNELFMEGHQKELQQIFNRAARLGVSGVHLDVEPHTRNDWDSRKEEYLQRYVEFLNRADKLAESLKIHPILCNILAQRGIETFDQAKQFFRPQLSDLHDPWLM